MSRSAVQHTQVCGGHWPASFRAIVTDSVAAFVGRAGWTTTQQVFMLCSCFHSSTREGLCSFACCVPLLLRLDAALPCVTDGSCSLTWHVKLGGCSDLTGCRMFFGQCVCVKYMLEGGGHLPPW